MARVQGWEPVCGARAERSPRGSGASMAPSTPTALEGWRCGWTTAASTCPTLSQPDPVLGHSAQLRPRNRKRTAWRSGGIARSRSKRCASLPEPQGGTRRSDRVRGAGTTRPGGSRSSGTTRRSLRRTLKRNDEPARRTSYAGRRSVNLCPKNWVRYSRLFLSARLNTLSAVRGCRPPLRRRRFVPFVRIIFRNRSSLALMAASTNAERAVTARKKHACGGPARP